MSNEIEIRVTSKDQTGPGFASVDAKIRALETSSTSTLGRMKSKFTQTGRESGEAFSSETLKGLEKGLAKAETQLAGARARLQKALALGGGEISKGQRASIEYDIKLHEESVAAFGAKIKAETARIGQEAGQQFGNRFSTGSLTELEKGLAKAEKDLTETKKRMDSALTQRQKQVIEYDVKVKEESVKQLKNKLKAEAERIGQEMADGNGKGFMARLAGLGRGLVKIGENMAQSVASGFSKIGSFIAENPVLVGAIAAGLAVIVPILGAGLTAAVGLGLGGGVIAAGVVAAFKSDRIAGALDSLKARAEKSFSTFGTYFISSTRQAVNSVRGIFDSLDAPLGRIATRFAPIVAKIGQGLAGLVKNMMPGLERAAMAFAPLLESLAEHLPKVGSALSDMFDSFAKGAPGAIKFFGYFMSWIETTLRMIGLLGEGMSKLFDPKFWLGGHAATKKAAAATKDLGVAEEEAAAAADKQASALQKVFDKMVSMGMVTLSLRDAERGFQQAIDDATGSLHQNGRTLDVNSAKGRSNSAALDNIAKSTFQMMDSQRKASASQSVLSGTLQRGADAAFNMARKMGMSTAAADAYTRSIFGIPPSRSTVIAAIGAAKSAAEVRALRAELARLTDRVVSVRTVFTTSGARIAGQGTQLKADGGVVGAAADGGARNGLTWVGERGPELLQLPAGSQVYTAGDSRRMAGAGGGQSVIVGPITINNYAADPNAVVRVLQRYAKDNNGIRLKGGVVTV